jgi:hypothetical protein
VRMDKNELPIKVLWTNPGGQGGRGRPKPRCIDGVEEDANKLACRNWQAAAQVRGHWQHCLRRSRHTHGCRAKDDDNDEDDDVLLAILTSYKRKLVTIYAVSTALTSINTLNAELNPMCCLLALLGAHHFLHVSRIRVKSLTYKRLMLCIYGAHILDVSRSHTTTQHSR